MNGSRTSARGRARLRATFAALLATLALGGVFAASASALPEKFYGLQHVSSSDPVEMDFLHRTGSRYLRLDIAQAAVNKNGWGFVNNAFGLAAERGITVIPILLVSNEVDPQPYPPSGGGLLEAEWLNFVKDAVGRYGYGGSFWTGRPNVLPPPAWEVLNEPNRVGPADAEKYGKILAAAASAIRGAQVGKPTKVLFGGLYWNATNAFLSGEEFFEDVRDYEKKQFGASGVSFDGLGLHPYALSGSSAEKILGVKANINAARAVLNSVGGGVSKTIWVTELGWQTGFSSEQITENTPQQQAELLRDSFKWIAEKSTEKKIEALIWHNAVDNGEGGWSNLCGLRTQNGVYRPVYQAFIERTGAPPWISDPTGFVDGSGNQHVYVDTQGGINHYVKTPGGSWNGEVLATGSFTSRPSVFIDPSGFTHLFVNTGGGLNHYVQSPGGSWSGEIVATYSGFRYTPTAFRDSGGTLHVYVNTGAAINHYYLNPGKSWVGEVAAYGAFSYAPAAFKDASGYTHLFANSGVAINHYIQSPGGSWSGEIPAMGSFSSAPVAAMDPGGTLHLVAGTLGGLNYYRQPSGKAWTGELIATGSYTFTSSPAMFVDTGGVPSVFVTTGGGLNQYWKPVGSGWNGAVLATTSLGNFSSEPSASLSGSNAHVYLETMGGINHYQYVPGSGWSGEIVVK